MCGKNAAAVYDSVIKCYDCRNGKTVIIRENFMSKLIYIADDEKNIRSLMRTFLESEGYEVETFSDGYSVRQALERRMPDMVILDVMMPGEDGLSICAGIRKNSGVPIMIVSAKDSPMDRVAGITLGSDDYITKPFLPLELTARVKALFRRAELSAGGAGESKETEYDCGNLHLNLLERRVYIRGESLPVTPTEFDFLLYLSERMETAVSKKELLEQVWGYQNAREDVRVPDDLVKRLRKKLRQQESTASVETIWGYGYRLTAKQD